MRVPAPPSPEWVEIVDGVRFRLRRPNGLHQAVVQAKVISIMGRLAEGAEVLEDYGFDAAEFSLLRELDYQAGFAQLVTACTYAEVLLAEWEGVTTFPLIGAGTDDDPLRFDTDADPVPAEVSPTSIRAAFLYGCDAGGGGPLLLDPFMRWLNAAAARRSLEKKGSGPGRNGASARPRPDTAAPAAKRAPRAHGGSETRTEAGAPASRMPRKPRKASSPPA